MCPAVAPDPKLKLLIETAGDMSIPLTDLQSRRALGEVEAEIARASDMTLLAHLYTARGGYNQRLGRVEKALDDYRLALQRLPGPSEFKGVVLSNRSAALLALGKYREAAEASIEAARIPPTDPCVNLSNLAEALDRLGLRELALETFAEALRIANLSVPRICFGLAGQAAEIGLDVEAVELLARFVTQHDGTELGDRAALDVVREALRAGLSLVGGSPLESTVKRAIAMSDELSRLATAKHVERSEVADREALAVYDTMAELRGRAIAATLGAAERAKA